MGGKSKANTRTIASRGKNRGSFGTRDLSSTVSRSRSALAIRFSFRFRLRVESIKVFRDSGKSMFNRDQGNAAQAVLLGRWNRILGWYCPGALCDYDGRPFRVRAAELIVQHDVKQGFVDTNASVVVDESKLAKAVHKEADAGARGADHLGKGFLGDGGDEGLGLAGLAKVGHQQKRACEALFAGIE